MACLCGCLHFMATPLCAQLYQAHYSWSCCPIATAAQEAYIAKRKKSTRKATNDDKWIAIKLMRRTINRNMTLAFGCHFLYQSPIKPWNTCTKPNQRPRNAAKSFLQDGLLAILSLCHLLRKVRMQLHKISHKDGYRDLAHSWHETNTLDT